MLLYSCDIKKNIKCKKRNCIKEYCSKTTDYKYAKKTPINYIKNIINKIIGIKSPSKNYIEELKSNSFVEGLIKEFEERR